MQIVCLSDTHLKHNFAVPGGDILIHAGDALFAGSDRELIQFNRWFSQLPHRHKIFVPGNHDRVFEDEYYHARSLLDSNIIYCEDSLIEVEGLRIYGSPWNEMSGWAFYKPLKWRRSKWEQIPDNLDILITHMPPYGIGDRVKTDDGRGYNLGCTALKEELLRIKPKYHIFGHIHQGYGKRRVQPTWFYNAAICDHKLRPVNSPLVFTL